LVAEASSDSYYGSPVSNLDAAIEVLLSERGRLVSRLEQEREQLETLQAVVKNLEERVAHDEGMLREIESALGKHPQLQLDQADIRLRGQRLEEVAVAVLAAEEEVEQPIHYRAWFELLRMRGYLVAGKKPLDTFLAQINRSPSVEKIGSRTGLYRLADAA
jgi:uncharacterized coiled-coil protein SlyX